MEGGGGAVGIETNQSPAILSKSDAKPLPAYSSEKGVLHVAVKLVKVVQRIPCIPSGP